MCLSVYIGCEHDFEAGNHEHGGLGFEPAEWRPPPLEGYRHVYYVGRKGDAGKLECSCTLLKHVVWDHPIGHVKADPLYPQSGECPFVTLRRFVEIASAGDRPVAIVCDDSGGVAQECHSNDYDHGVITLDMIKRDNFLFADPIAMFPWRAFYLIYGREVTESPVPHTLGYARVSTPAKTSPDRSHGSPTPVPPHLPRRRVG